MRRMKTLRWTMVLATLLFAGIAGREHQAREQASVQLASLEKKRAEALDHIQRLHIATTAAEKDDDELRLALERVKSAHSTGVLPPNKGGSGAPLTQLDAIARSPELQAKYFATRRRDIMNAYGPLVRRLGLTPDQASRFYDQLMGFDQVSQDLVMAARIQDVSLDDPALAKLKQEAWSQLKIQQAELLGPAAEEDVHQFNRTLGARAIVVKFLGVAAYFGVPLSPEQANQMTQTIADANLKYQKGGDSDLTQVDWTLADEKLRAVLTSAQLALFQRNDPVAGGASRWTSSLTRAITDAKAADRTPTTVVNASPPGG